MIVLDCSAAISIVRETPEGCAFMQLMETGEETIAPDLFSYEVANVISTYMRVAGLPEEAGVMWCKFAQALVNTYVSAEELVLEALSESVRLSHSAYDMFYLVLARRNAATLFTLDKKLQELCLANGVNSVLLDNA